VENKRDDFSIKTKRLLAQRVGYLCSNPKCQKPTSGPHSDPEKSISIGVAAHISAASKNGPRANSLLTSKKRKDISNGIWLCQNCSVLIDRDEIKYSPKIIEKWKDKAEKFIDKAIESRHYNIKICKVDKSIETDDKVQENQYFHLSKDNELVFRYFNNELKLNYFPKKTDWNISENYLNWKNPYYYILLNLPELYSEIGINQIDVQNKFQKIINKDGIDGLCEHLFDIENINSVPKFKEFRAVILDFFGEKDVLKAMQPVGSRFYVKYKNIEYVVDTYTGLQKELESYFSAKSYSEIYTMTNMEYWSNIYLDAGIEKAIFIPELLKNWERFWIDEYKQISQRIGKTSYLDAMKERSWRQFQIFSEGYNEAGDIIKFSYDLDDLDLYPLVVYSMLNIFDKECCYQEYCELEFECDDWESICLDKEEYNTPIFYIKKN
jgi:hypothetical protein